MPKIKAKVIGVRDYSFDTKDGQKLVGQNVYVSYSSEGVTGHLTDCFKNFESKTNVKVPPLEIGKEYKFIVSTDEHKSKSIEMIFDLSNKEIPMIEDEKPLKSK